MVSRERAGGRTAGLTALGLLAQVLVVACTQTAGPAAIGPSGGRAGSTGVALAATTASAITERPVPMVWTDLYGGGRVRHPAGWRAFALPLGLTPGSHLVLALGTATTNPCRWRTSGTGSEGGCWWDRLPPGGVEVTWATQLPRQHPEAPTRTWSAATAQCAGLGGSRSLTATAPHPGGDPGRQGFVVTACLAGPDLTEAQDQVDAMLDSLRA